MSNSARDRRIKELMLYIAMKLAAKRNYGTTLLNKVLYFIDRYAYIRNGRTISEFKYIKQKHGPTPEPSLFLFIKDQLIASGDLEVNEVNFFGHTQKRFIAKRMPEVRVFSADELMMIDDVISYMGDLNGVQVSDFSHQFPAWKAASEKEELPFFTFLLSSKQPSKNDIDWAKAEIERCTE